MEASRPPGSIAGPKATQDNQETRQSVPAQDEIKLSAIESLPQEILDSIASELTWREHTPLMRSSRTLYYRLRYGLYRDAVPRNEGLLIWACEKGHLQLVCQMP